MKLFLRTFTFIVNVRHFPLEKELNIKRFVNLGIYIKGFDKLIS